MASLRLCLSVSIAAEGEANGLAFLDAEAGLGALAGDGAACAGGLVWVCGVGRGG